MAGLEVCGPEGVKGSRKDAKTQRRDKGVTQTREDPKGRRGGSAKTRRRKGGRRVNGSNQSLAGKACGRPVSILPSFLLRSRRYLLAVVRQVVTARFAALGRLWITVTCQLW